VGAGETEAQESGEHMGTAGRRWGREEVSLESPHFSCLPLPALPFVGRLFLILVAAGCSRGLGVVFLALALPNLCLSTLTLWSGCSYLVSGLLTADNPSAPA
jgi:hypothetical protein